MSIKRVAVLGLGLMGGGMARQLIASGFETTVWNRNPAKAAPFAAERARVAASPAEAARDADLVIAMLADDDASRTVWTGPDGALAAMREGAIAVESSTLTIDWIRELAALAAPRGVRFLDAPVTGSRDQAAAGALRFIVGGDADAFAAATPAFVAMGSSAEHLGPLGSGIVFKLANNFLCGVQVATMAEALAMLEANGLDMPRAVDLLVNGAPGSPLAKGISQRMLDRAYTPHFLVPLMAKDLDYAERAFRDAGIDLATAAAARTRFETAAAQGLGDRDIAAIIEPLRKTEKP